MGRWLSVRRSYPLALYTHCAIYGLSLALSKAYTVPIVRNSLVAVRIDRLRKSFRPAKQFAGWNCYSTSAGERDVHHKTQTSETASLDWAMWVLVGTSWAISSHCGLPETHAGWWLCISTSWNAALLLNSLRTCANIITRVMILAHVPRQFSSVYFHWQTHSSDWVDCCSEPDTAVLL